MIKKIVAGMLAFLMASAMATGRENIFEGVTFEELKPQLEAEGNLKDGRFPTMVLAQAAAGYLKAEGKTTVREDLVAQAWMQHYKWPQTMTAAEFDQGKFYVDDDFIAKVNQAGGNAAMVKAVDRVAQAAPVQTPTPAVQSPVAPTDDGIAKAVASLNGKVAALENRGNINVEALKAELKAVAEAQAKATSKAEYTALAGKLTTLTASINDRFAEVDRKMGELAATQTQTTEQVTTLKGTVATLGATVEEQGKSLIGVDGRLTAVEGKVGATSPLVIVALVVAAIALAFAVLRKRGGGVTEGKVAQMVEEKVVKVVGLNTTAFNTRLNVIEGQVKGVVEKTEELRRDTGHNRVVFDGGFNRIVSAINADTATNLWVCRIEGQDGEYPLIIQGVGEGKVNVLGIEGQTNAVKVSNLKAVIGRAAQPYGDLAHRIVGASKDDLQSYSVLKEPLATPTDHVETVSDQPETVPVSLSNKELIDRTNAVLASPAFQAEAEALANKAAKSPVKAGPKVTTKTVLPMSHDGVMTMLGAKGVKTS